MATRSEQMPYGYGDDQYRGANFAEPIDVPPEGERVLLSDLKIIREETEPYIASTATAVRLHADIQILPDPNAEHPVDAMSGVKANIFIPPAHAPLMTRPFKGDVIDPDLAPGAVVLEHRKKIAAAQTAAKKRKLEPPVEDPLEYGPWIGDTVMIYHQVQEFDRATNRHRIVYRLIDSVSDVLPMQPELPVFCSVDKQTGDASLTFGIPGEFTDFARNDLLGEFSKKERKDVAGAILSRHAFRGDPRLPVRSSPGDITEFRFPRGHNINYVQRATAENARLESLGFRSTKDQQQRGRQLIEQAGYKQRVMQYGVSGDAFLAPTGRVMVQGQEVQKMEEWQLVARIGVADMLGDPNSPISRENQDGSGQPAEHMHGGLYITHTDPPGIPIRMRIGEADSNLKVLEDGKYFRSVDEPVPHTEFWQYSDVTDWLAGSTFLDIRASGNTQRFLLVSGRRAPGIGMQFFMDRYRSSHEPANPGAGSPNPTLEQVYGGGAPGVSEAPVYLLTERTKDSPYDLRGIITPSQPVGISVSSLEVRSRTNIPKRPTIRFHEGTIEAEKQKRKLSLNGSRIAVSKVLTESTPTFEELRDQVSVVHIVGHEGGDISIDGHQTTVDNPHNPVPEPMIELPMSKTPVWWSEV
jgi:hypothetical protein